MNLKGVSMSVWVRILATALILANLVSVSIFDYQLIPFSDEEIYEGVSVFLTVVAGFWVGWKNNSFTKKAQEADKVLKGVK